MISPTSKALAVFACCHLWSRNHLVPTPQPTQRRNLHSTERCYFVIARAACSITSATTQRIFQPRADKRHRLIQGAGVFSFAVEVAGQSHIAQFGQALQPFPWHARLSRTPREIPEPPAACPSWSCRNRARSPCSGHLLHISKLHYACSFSSLLVTVHLPSSYRPLLKGAFGQLAAFDNFSHEYS